MTLFRNMNIDDNIDWVNEIDSDNVFSLDAEDIEPITVNCIKQSILDLVDC